MTISRATMKQQLKGNRMKKNLKKSSGGKMKTAIKDKMLKDYGKSGVKKGANPRKSIEDLILEVGTEQGLFEKKSGGRMKKKPVTKAKFGKFLEATSPLYSAMKGKGLVKNIGKGGLFGLAASALDKKKKKGAMPSSGGQQAPQGMTATPMAAATPLKGGGRTKNKKPVVKAFSGLSAKLDPVGMAMRVIKKSSPEKFGNFQKEIASKFGGDPNFKKAMKKLGVPTLAAAPRMMSSGGSLNRKKSVDGIAQRGKTRAR